MSDMTLRRITVFAFFAPLLQRAGFRKTYDSRAGGVRAVEWQREETDGRTLVAQIWADGKHRLSHRWVGCSDTSPTDFESEAGLADAIQRETTRTDSRYRDPNNHYVPAAREFLLLKQAAAAPKVQP